ncbi:DUF4040 domain-containing protein [Bacillus licheniformis]|nr:DUF4040 domain-containing protein [Bacillus licheniformis]
MPQPLPPFCKVKTDGDYRTRRHRLHARAVLCHFRAPDLALTQLIIETISVALFLLCFYHCRSSDLSRNRLGSGSQMRLYRSASELL